MPSSRRNARNATLDTTSLLSSSQRAQSGLPTTPSAEERQAEMDATFGSDDDEEVEDKQRYQHHNQNHRGDTRNRIETRIDLTEDSPAPGDVFFDAGEAIDSDPLGASNQSASLVPLGNAPPYSPPPPPPTQTRNLPRLHPVTTNTPAQNETYDFEGASYFTPNRPHMSRANSVNVSRVASPRLQDRMEMGHLGSEGARINNSNQNSMSRMRLALGRFGRLVGMRVPGAVYSSVNTDDEGSAQLPRTSARGVMGGGMSQDGVFANMNAKPERRRRREGGEDRGDDDDLVDDILPPTYETAAADVAPPYWETTIIGGPGGLHPLAPGGMGWTPGGAHVGAIEDLIVEGLPVGNFFGFAWNLLVSMSFQFVGFLLTYLLHTTHAARCGSRAGLGITLVQYGFYLRTRAMQLADGKMPDDGLAPLPSGSDDTATATTSAAHSVWWTTVGKAPAVEQGARDWISRGVSLVIRQTITRPNVTAAHAGNTTTLADILAADDGGLVVPSPESMSASTEWLAYILMGIGWFILLSSILSYWRVHRWGKQLVDAARRESDADNNNGNNNGTVDTNSNEEGAPVGFLQTLRFALRNASRGNTRQHSAEDWVIFPGRHPSQALLQDPDTSGLSTSNDERLVTNMRSVGLIA